jgi:RsiW-degrading membrane proteinase PrsW (M82 family)
MMIVESIHWGVALIPVLVMLSLFVWLDAFALMSLKEVIILLVLGGLAALVAWPISGRLLDTLPIGFSLYSRFVAPWIEEAIKAAAMIALFRMNRIGYKLDAIISGFAIGAGFSVVENIFYLTLFPAYGTGTWLVRGFGTAIMHGTTLAVLAAIAHEFAERETREAAGDYDFSLLWFVPGYGVAVALHTGFNQFPDQPMIAMMEAEEAMMEEAVGDAEFDAEKVRAAFAELDGLKTALGRSTLAALQALLPFSRNDLWEVAELRQRLNRR